MTNRITDSMLQARIDRLNKLTGSPMAPYIQNANGKWEAQIGNFHLSHAYGGVCVHRMVNESGGCSTPIVYGHVTKRECFDALCAFMAGIEFSQQMQEVAA